MSVEAMEDYHPGPSSATSGPALDLDDSIIEDPEQDLVWTA
jgi:hypothetical protein